jgi:hypothetical protein
MIIQWEVKLILTLLVNNVIANLAFTILNTDNTGNSAKVAIWNSQIPANNALLGSYPVRFVSIVFTDDGPKHDLVTVKLSMPQTYLEKVFLKITNDKFPNGIYLKGSL